MSHRLLIVLAVLTLLGAVYFGLIRSRGMGPLTRIELEQRSADALEAVSRLNAEAPVRREDPGYAPELQRARGELMRVKMEQMNRQLAPALFAVSLLCWGVWLWFKLSARQAEASPTAGVSGPAAEVILAELDRRKSSRQMEIAQLRSGGDPPAIQGE